MANIIALEATKREKAGKGASRAVRRTGLVPAVVYGDKKAPVLLSLTEKTLVAHLNKKGFWTHQFEIQVDGEKHRTLCQDVQFHRVSGRPIHADFLRIAKNSVLTLEIPVHVINEDKAPGLRDGGVLNLVHRSIEVHCSPDNIPESLELDVTDLNIDDTLTTKNLVLPKGVKLVHEDETTLLTIAPPAKEEVEVAPVAVEAAPAEPAKVEEKKEEGK